MKSFQIAYTTIIVRNYPPYYKIALKHCISSEMTRMSYYHLHADYSNTIYDFDQESLRVKNKISSSIWRPLFLYLKRADSFCQKSRGLLITAKDRGDGSCYDSEQNLSEGYPQVILRIDRNALSKEKKKKWNNLHQTKDEDTCLLLTSNIIYAFCLIPLLLHEFSMNSCFKR